MSDLTLDDYQEQTAITALYPGAGKGTVDAIAYSALGLTGEAGEIANKVKKIIRDEKGVLSEEKRLDILAELGDVCWYLARLCTEMGGKWSDVAQSNLDKLESRRKRGVITGSGDNR